MNRAMLGRMMMRAGAGQLPPGTILIGVAGSPAEASSAVAAGADLVDLGAAPSEMITAFLARHPGIPVCATSSSADVVRDPAAARVTGALLICTDAESAVASGIRADRVLVDVLPAVVPMVNEAGLAALVDADRAAGLAAQQDPADRSPADRGPGDQPGRDSADGDLARVAGIVAIAAVSSWLGARAVRTRYPVEVRRALDMSASVRGIRAPTRTIRGLA